MKRVGGRFFGGDMRKIWKKWFVLNDKTREFMDDNELDLKTIKIPDQPFMDWYYQKTAEFVENGYDVITMRNDRSLKGK